MIGFRALRRPGSPPCGDCDGDYCTMTCSPQPTAWTPCCMCPIDDQCVAARRCAMQEAADGPTIEGPF